jgi:excisionase family DNA binding protein
VTERLLTARELAERLGVSTETVLRWARRGRLPAVYLSSRAIRFREADIDAWLEQRATPRRGVRPATPDAARWQATPPLQSVARPATEDEE